ncbi:SRPBCC family protein [Tateyamaria sp. ANG-S1]|uniref:SRPBCC family protein n=1 Tax=Tateyamaria sp. ANG-S1 TaxID=1577905 RepID=UPI00057C6A05|nr:SRPBCC family protein [Tateyamaria sp. ANG-S1]KIC51894.1 DNA polymerase III subunit gamma/tau [Tateyamaria sp. ANG-S1]
MKFSAREDVAAPIEAVFEALNDFESFERQAMRRGAQVRRIDPLTQPGVGMQWEVSFRMRGRMRELDLKMARYDAPNEMVFDVTSAGVTGSFSIELMALSRNRTRMALALELTPLTLSARLFVQSLKLAKTSLNKRFKLRVADYAKGLEDRLQRSA